MSERMFKSVAMKVFLAGREKPVTRTYRAGPRSRFTSAGVDTLLEEVADHLEATFPDQEFRLVQIGPAAFNFVAAPQELTDEIPARV
jgi:hypothetical protein